MLIDKNRMEAEGSEQTVIGFNQLPYALPVVPSHPHQQQASDTQVSAIGQHRVAVGIEVGKVQMGMSVDIGSHAHSIGRSVSRGKRGGQARFFFSGTCLWILHVNQWHGASEAVGRSVAQRLWR